MEANELRTLLENIVCQVADIPVGTLKDDTDLTSLGVDSISLLTAVCLVEDACGLSLQDNNLFEISFFGELVDFVGERVYDRAKQ